MLTVAQVTDSDMEDTVEVNCQVHVKDVARCGPDVRRCAGEVLTSHHSADHTHRPGFMPDSIRHACMCPDTKRFPKMPADTPTDIMSRDITHML